MIAKLVIVVWFGFAHSAPTSMTSYSVDVYPLAEQNAFDHCKDLGDQTKVALAKDGYKNVSAVCYDIGEPTE